MAHAITNNVIILFQGKSKLFAFSSFYLVVIRINFKHIIGSFLQHST